MLDSAQRVRAALYTVQRAKAQNEKSPLWRRASFGKTGLWRAQFFWFIYLIRAGDDMHKYSNPSTQKLRVLYE